jgi:hypothetical protein
MMVYEENYIPRFLPGYCQGKADGRRQKAEKNRESFLPFAVCHLPDNKNCMAGVPIWPQRICQGKYQYKFVSLLVY